MWVCNKETGLIWEVDGELADRLSQHPDFEVIPAPDGEISEEKQKKPQPKKKLPGETI